MQLDQCGQLGGSRINIEGERIIWTRPENDACRTTRSIQPEERSLTYLTPSRSGSPDSSTSSPLRLPTEHHQDNDNRFRRTRTAHTSTRARPTTSSVSRYPLVNRIVVVTMLIEFENRRGHYHRPGIPSPCSLLPPQQDPGRVHDQDESKRVGGQGAGESTKGSTCPPRLPHSRRVYHQVSRSETGRYDHEGAAGVGRDEDYSGSSLLPSLLALLANVGFFYSIKRLRVYCNEERNWTHWSFVSLPFTEISLIQFVQVDKSQALSSSSKAFFKTAKSQNSCCVVM